MSSSDSITQWIQQLKSGELALGGGSPDHRRGRSPTPGASGRKGEKTFDAILITANSCGT